MDYFVDYLKSIKLPDGYYSRITFAGGNKVQFVDLSADVTPDPPNPYDDMRKTRRLLVSIYVDNQEVLVCSTRLGARLGSMNYMLSDPDLTKKIEEALEYFATKLR